MCRFVLYLGPSISLSSLITEPGNSIIHQSYRSRERVEPLNGDGFGVAWYAGEVTPEAAQFRSIGPAWSNQNLRHLARVTRSPCVLAHVRAATPGLPVTETNTHPFVWGRYAFMHNGEVGGFAQVKRRLLDRLGDEAYRLIEGTTDSEHVFALFVERLLTDGAEDPAERVASALKGAVEDVLDLCAQARVEEPSYLNLAVADGSCAAVCRYTNGAAQDAPSLHLHTGRTYICEGGVCRMIEPGPDGRAVIVASEPLSEDPGWSVVPPNHVVVLGTDRTAQVRSLGSR
jgi:ergothioneine biosynthesis protein EgtC